MKVLHINTYDSAGGAEKIAYTLYKYQKDAVLLVKGKLKYFDDENIIEFKKIGLDKAFFILDKIAWKLGYKKKLRTLFQGGDEFHLTYKKLKKLKAYQEADIVHLHNIHGFYFDLHALGNIAKEKKIIWTVHDMWPITGGEAYLFETSDCKNEHLNNRLLYQKYPLYGPLIDRRNYFLQFKKKIYKQYAKNFYFVPVSNWLKNCIYSSVVYNPDLQMEVIYNGIDPSKFQNHQKRVWSVPRVIFFNSDNSFKGSDFFIKHLNDIQVEFELYVVGMPIQKDIRPDMKIHHLERTTDENQLVNYFNNIDILVFPSTAEAFGLLPAEAMLCGVMVVSSNAGGLKELIIEGETGALFNNGDGKDLVQKLEQVLMDLDKARNIGAQSRKYVECKFNLDNMILSYEHLYHKVLGN